MNILKEYYFSKKIDLCPSTIHGFGQFANQVIDQGEVVLTAGGFLASINELKVYAENQIISWIFVPNIDCVLITPCGERMNASGLNHSCFPNLVFNFPDWKTSRIIRPGEELTIDYSSMGYVPKGVQLFSHCLCGEKNCRNIVFT